MVRILRTIFLSGYLHRLVKRNLVFKPEINSTSIFIVSHNYYLVDIVDISSCINNFPAK